MEQKEQQQVIDPTADWKRLHDYRKSEWYDAERDRGSFVRHHVTSLGLARETDSDEQLLTTFFGKGTTMEQAEERIGGRLENLFGNERRSAYFNLSETEQQEKAEGAAKAKKQQQKVMPGASTFAPGLVLPATMGKPDEPTQQEVDEQRQEQFAEAFAQSPELVYAYGRQKLTPRHMAIAVAITDAGDHAEEVAENYYYEITALSPQEYGAFKAVVAAGNPKLDRTFYQRFLPETFGPMASRAKQFKGFLENQGLDLITYHDRAHEFAERLEKVFDDPATIFDEEGRVKHGIREQFETVVKNAGGRYAMHDAGTMARSRQQEAFLREHAARIYQDVLDRREHERIMYDVEQATVPRYSELPALQEFSLKASAITADMLSIAAISSIPHVGQAAAVAYTYGSHQQEMERELVNRHNADPAKARLVSSAFALPWAMTEYAQVRGLDPKRWQPLFSGMQRNPELIGHYLAEFGERAGGQMVRETGEEYLQAAIDFSMKKTASAVAEAEGIELDEQLSSMLREMVEATKYMPVVTLAGGGLIGGARSIKNRRLGDAFAPEFTQAIKDLRTPEKQWFSVAKFRRTLQEVEAGVVTPDQLDALPQRVVDLVRNAESNAEAAEALKEMGYPDPEQTIRHAELRNQITDQVNELKAVEVEEYRTQLDQEFAVPDDAPMIHGPKFSRVEQALDQYGLGVDLKIYETQKEALAAHPELSAGADQRIEAVLLGNTVVMIDEHLENAQHAYEKFGHEVFGHKGLDLSPKRTEFVQSLVGELGADFLRGELPEFYEGLNETQAADEYLARVVEKAVRQNELGSTEQEKKLWDRFKSFMVDQLDLRTVPEMKARQVAGIARELLNFSQTVDERRTELYPEGIQARLDGKIYTRTNGTWTNAKGRPVKNPGLVERIEKSADNAAYTAQNVGSRKRNKIVREQIAREDEQDPVVSAVLDNGGIKMPHRLPGKSYPDEVAAIPKRFRSKKGGGVALDIAVQRVEMALSANWQQQNAGNEQFDESSLVEYLANYEARADDLRQGRRLTDDEEAERQAQFEAGTYTPPEEDIDALFSVWDNEGLYKSAENEAELSRYHRFVEALGERLPDGYRVEANEAISTDSLYIKLLNPDDIPLAKMRISDHDANFVREGRSKTPTMDFRLGGGEEAILSNIKGIESYVEYHLYQDSERKAAMARAIARVKKLKRGDKVSVSLGTEAEKSAGRVEALDFEAGEEFSFITFRALNGSSKILKGGSLEGREMSVYQAALRAHRQNKPLPEGVELDAIEKNGRGKEIAVSFKWTYADGARMLLKEAAKRLGYYSEERKKEVANHGASLLPGDPDRSQARTVFSKKDSPVEGNEKDNTSQEDVNPRFSVAPLSSYNPAAGALTAEHLRGIKGHGKEEQHFKNARFSIKQLTFDDLPDAGRAAGPEAPAASTEGSLYRFVSKYAPSLQQIGEVNLAEQVLSTPEKAGALIESLFSPAQERMVLIPLDAEMKVMESGVILLSSGTVSSSLADPKLVLQAYAASGATHLILAHNHPSGDSSPSREDVLITERIHEAFEKIGRPDVIKDHLIQGDSLFSMREMAYFEPDTDQPAQARTASSLTASTGTLPVQVLWGSERDKKQAVELSSSSGAVVTPEALRQLGETLLRPDEGLLFVGLDTKLKPIAFYATPQGAEQAQEAIRLLAQSPAISRLVVASKGVLSEIEAREMVAMAEQIDAKILDIYQLEQTQSMREAGTVRFSVADPSLDQVVQSWKDLGIDSFMYDRGDEIYVGRIVVPRDARKQGVGTQAMKQLVDFADAANKRIVLSPSKDFGATSIDRLKRFYKRFGFVENKGGNKDYRISETMYRMPRARFSVAQRLDAQRETAVWMASKIFGGEKVAVEQVATTLERSGASPELAPQTLEDARSIAAQVIARRGELENDRRIHQALREAEIRNHYKKLIAKAHVEGLKGGRLFEKARADVMARMERQATQQLDAMPGLAPDDLSKHNLAPIDLLKQLELAEKRQNPRSIEQQPDAPREELPEFDEDGSVIEGSVPETAPEPQKELPQYKEEVEDYLYRLKGAVVSSLVEAEQIDPLPLDKALRLPIVRRQYAKTVQNLLRESVNNLTYGHVRDQLMKQVIELGEKKRLATIDNKAFTILERAFNQRVREDRYTLIEQIWKMTDGYKGRIAALTEQNKRKVAARTELYFKMVRRTLAKSAPEMAKAAGVESTAIEDVSKAIRDRIAQIEHLDPPEGIDAIQWRAQLRDELDALYRFGNLRFKTLAQVGEAHDFLKNKLEAALEEQQKKVDVYRRDIERKKADLHDVLPESVTPSQRRTLNQKMRDWLSKFLPLQYRLEQVALLGKGEQGKRADKLLADYASKLSDASNAADNEVYMQSMALRSAIEQIYQKDAYKVLKELAEPREEYRTFSKNSMDLNRAQLLQLLAYVQQKQYRETNPYRAAQEAELLKAVSPQDLKLLDWLRSFYRNERDALSAVNERVTGLPVESPDPLYMPVSIEQERDGLDSFIHVLEFIPRSLTPRVYHKRDIDESLSIFDLFNDRLRKNAQYKHFVEIGMQLRDVLGEHHIKKAMERVHGKEFTDQLTAHLTDVIKGKAPPKLRDGVAAWLTKYTAYTSLSFNFRMLMRQPTSFPAFGYHMKLGDVMKYAMEGQPKLIKLIHERREGTRSEGDDVLSAMHDILDSDHAKTRMGQGYMHVMRDILESGEANLIERFLQTGMKLNTYGDIVPTLIVGQGIYRARKAEAIKEGKSESEAKQFAMDRLWQIMNLSQQSSSMINQSEYIRRGDAFSKLVAQFTTTPQQYLAQQFNEFEKMRAKKENAFGKTVFLNHIVLPLLYHGMNLLINTLEGDEPEKEDWLRLLAMMLIGPSSGWLIAGSIIEIAAESTVTGKAPYGSSLVPADRVLKDTRVIMGIGQAIVDWDGEEMLKEVDRLGRSISAPYREVRKAVKNYADE